jgi:leukotriene-A4 hydrolase
MRSPRSPASPMSISISTSISLARRCPAARLLDILAARGAKQIVLDVDDLDIASITDRRRQAAPYTVGPRDKELGSALTILLNGNQIASSTKTKPGASALQWLAPELTAGKKQALSVQPGPADQQSQLDPDAGQPRHPPDLVRDAHRPDGFVAVMSGERLDGAKGELVPHQKRRFRFRMDKPVPPYLIALAVGDLAFKATGPRSGVWTEPSMLDGAAHEVGDVEKMIDAAEALYGPYRWGRYDMLVLPPSFPFGGMENPTLTFLTPTIVTGDRSNTDVVAHELAHSWSGNLVTNATWSDSWLNEGFTTYFENRIMEAVYGKERAAMYADLDWDGLQSDITDAGGQMRRPPASTAIPAPPPASSITSRARPSCARSSARSAGALRRLSALLFRSPRLPAADQRGLPRRHPQEPDQGRQGAGGRSSSSIAGPISPASRERRPR